jgi:aryl-alcohol dehydrogenase-like predicted oxidoreductase
MEYRILGRTGIEVSAVGLGCSQIRGTLPPGEKGWTGLTDEEAIASIRRAIEGRRQEYVVATKVTPLPGNEKDPFYSRCLRHHTSCHPKRRRGAGTVR